MPEQGIEYVDRDDLLRYEEMLRLVHILTDHGVEKVRITGGEPFVRKNLLYLLERLRRIEALKRLSITTNGTLTGSYLPDLERLGIRSINLSIDSFDPDRFRKITRRDDFLKVQDTFHQLIERGFDVKINCVVMQGINEVDVLPMARLVYQYPVSVRFIEEMPFNGAATYKGALEWNHRKILETLQNEMPDIRRVNHEDTATSEVYEVPGGLGHIGIIAAYSRTFCGTCDRIRLTPTGHLRTCLYGGDELDVRDLLRSQRSDQEILEAVQNTLYHRKKDGFEAERAQQRAGKESMSKIGG